MSVRLQVTAEEEKAPVLMSAVILKQYAEFIVKSLTVNTVLSGVTVPASVKLFPFTDSRTV
jgi:hypothetical protein